LLVSSIFLDEDIDDPKYLIDPFIDTHLLTLETNEDKGIALADFTQVGLGLATGDQKCILVELYT